MSFREGRGRARWDDYPSRSEERKSHHGRSNNPPSRHLWIGNLSHSLTEKALAHHFLQFGDLEKIAFQPGRSYAFINYIDEEDAFAAVKELQGFVLGGNPIRIEFAKPEKSSIPPREADYPEYRDEPYHKSRDSPYSHRDSRPRRYSPDPSHPNKPNKMNNDKDSEPSEVLWIGFPAQLKIDEFILRKAFSPFGEIENITAFPGRTFAFIRFRNVISARRAKEALHGKLFGNPRVHICFAKNESGPSNRDRTVDSLEHFRSNPRVRSPPFIPKFDDRSLYQGHVDIYEPRLDSPKRNMDSRRHSFGRRDKIYDDDPWDLPEEDVSLLRGTKKLKSNNMFPHESDNELPEYPLSDLEKMKRAVPLDQNYDSRHSGYKPVPKHLMNAAHAFGERGDHWDTSRDDVRAGSILMDRRRLSPERGRSSSKELWKWEGMISKGGTSVCRARCFPVGKPPDMVLPEYLDCTARTSLDMLAKHYYQAASAWVVFFAPADDPDISYYNDFMTYLGEKQRAAVVKLDERTTLFLVPPSEFSEKVLKVPGRLSISGVILRLLEIPSSSYGPTPQIENRDPPSSYQSFQGDFVNSPSGPPYLPTQPFTNNNYDYAQKPAVPGPNWSHRDFHNSNPMSKNFTSQAFNNNDNYTQEVTTHGNYTPDNNNIPGYHPSGTGKFPVLESPRISSSGLPAEQLAQLTSSLVGQQGQSSGGEYKPSGNINQSEYSFQTSQNYGLPNNQVVSSEFLQSQVSKMQQLQQQSTSLGSSQATAVVQDDAEADPQTRLQATLQLAAALLQQIQQGKGT
ncbi:hypothetical protein CASFOL_024507 [Castilleja foliolosa]|uniref:RRM domain-containing protein n=1 Tax=Castilleja foliolosa TaxID=1961234 RepID=A0ABD3CNJ6_9LAMI